MPPDPFLSRLLTRLAPLGPVRPRAMFGGHGLYLDGDHIAIVDGNRVYFRVDPQSAVEPGAKPFTYRRQGKTVALRGYRMPPATDEILPWAERAVATARAQRRSNAVRR